MPPALRARIEAGRPRFEAMALQQYGLAINSGPFGIDSRAALIGEAYAAARGMGDAFHDAVAAAYPDADQDRLDGLTVDLGAWWFNLRPSNTEPLLRLNLEAPTDADVAERVAEVQALMAQA